MRLFLIAIAALICMPTPAGAASSEPWREEASNEKAHQIFWSFSNCIVQREPKAVVKLLSVVDWGKSEAATAQKLAQDNFDCSVLGGERLRFGSTLFHGALASAYLSQKYAGRMSPDYSSVAPVFGQKDIDANSTHEWRYKIFLLIMAECVVRSDTKQVLQLFATKPFSVEEKSAFAPLMPLIGNCVPAEEGFQIKVNTALLRGYLGEAGYALDRKL